MKDKIYSKQELAQMLDSPEWIRASASFNVLGSPVIIGGLSDHEQHKARQDGDRPHLGCCYLRPQSPHQRGQGQGDTYKELETPSKVHGLVGACFSRMWMAPSLAA